MLSLHAPEASGAIIAQGLYRLHNHPDGAIRPPLYGLRLDELYNVTTGHDNFTFNFDHASSAMYLYYAGTWIHIFGQSYGGRDVGGAYAADNYLGVYQIDFLYNIGVQLVPGDDDVMVELPPGPNYNFGTLIPPASVPAPFQGTTTLRDGHYTGAQKDFRFGDTDNDLGHRGFPGLSGWGWLFHKNPAQTSFYPYVADSDWLFTAELVPTPSAVALVGAAIGLATVRRRRSL